MNPLVLALVISMAANGFVGMAWLKARDRATAAESSRDQWKGSAETCGQSVVALQAAGKRQAASAAKKVEAARVTAGELFRAADRDLSTPASVAGDDCKSAMQRKDKFLQERAQ